MTGDVPGVGSASDEYRAVCVYSLRPGEPQCGEPAVMHVGMKESTNGKVALATCGGHLPIARAAGEFDQEHRYEGWCGFPATRWSHERNECFLDDTGVEPVVKAEAALTTSQ